jgi:signal transduction histidine kinase
MSIGTNIKFMNQVCQNKYKLILKNKKNSGQREILCIDAHNDKDAIEEVKRGLQTVFYGSNGQIFGYDWNVETLVNIETEKNIWTNSNSNMSGGNKKRTKQTIKIGNKERRVYVGPKGGRYVKTSSGAFRRI